MAALRPIRRPSLEGRTVAVPMTSPPRRHIHLLRATLALLLVVILHLATAELETPPAMGLNDKATHLAAFFVLALLTDFSFPASRFTLWKITGLLLYGGLIETIQYHLPYRTFSLMDLAADGLGIAAYGLSVPLLRRLPILKNRWHWTLKDCG
jgi:VanZ family protein